MKKRKTLCSLMLCFVLAAAMSVAAQADMGPKDSLTVYVEHPPDELYYLDLLWQPSGNDTFVLNSNLQGNYDAAMLSLLYSYEDEGWLPALAEGTGIPMWGDLTGIPSGERMVHVFGYFGLPQTYRIIVVTQSGAVTVTEPYTRTSLQSSVYYDYAVGSTYITEDDIAGDTKDDGVTLQPTWQAYAAQFALTCTLTLLLEGIILLLFRISLKENWKVFLLVNVITQVLLTCTVGIALVRSGPTTAHLIQVPAELVILAGETLVFRRFMKGASNKRKIAYGITANAVSWLAGALLLNQLFLLLAKLL